MNRFTLGVGELSRGIDFVLVAMGVFGLGEVISMLNEESVRSRWKRFECVIFTPPGKK